MDPYPVLQIGKIIGVFGIKGELKVFRMARDTAHFDQGKRIMLQVKDQKNETWMPCTVNTVKPYKNILRIRFDEIRDRDSAEKLVGAGLFIFRSELPEAEPGSWYWCDLIGLDVYDSDNRYIGRVTSMIETGSNDVFVITGNDEETLVPAIDSVVIDIDTSNGRMLVDLPEGLEE